MIKDLIRKYKVLLLILMPVYVGILLISITPSAYSVTLPGGVTLIDSEISIPSDVSNEFYSVYVMSVDRPTILQVLLSSLSDKNHIEKVSHKPSFFESVDSGTLFKELSYTNALITAYEAAAMIDDSVSIAYDTLGYVVTFSNSHLHIKDIITHVDGIDVFSLEAGLIAYLKDNDTVIFTILRQGEVKDITLKKVDGRFGISLSLYRKIKTTSPIYQTSFKMHTTFGPSGGLLQALSIYSSLLNIKYPLKIGGTGTIEADQSIGMIGGVTQKIYTVDGLVDIFFVPEANYNEALKAYEKLDKPSFTLHQVGDFNDALSILNSYR